MHQFTTTTHYDIDTFHHSIDLIQVDKTLEMKKWSRNGPLQQVMKQ